MEGGISSGGGTAGGGSSAAPASAQSSTPSNGASSPSGGSADASGTTPSSALSPSTGGKPVAKANPEADWRYRDKIPAKNGAVRDIELTREELRRKISIADAQEEGFRALKAERERDAQARARLKSQNEDDRLEALRELGFDPDDFAKSRLAKLARLELMSPEERRAFEAEEGRKVAEAKAAKYEADVKERTQREQEKRQWDEYAPQFQKELAAYDIPLEPWTMELLANVALGFNEAEIDANPSMMAQELNRRLDGLFVQRLKKLPVEQLEKRLGEDTLKKLFARRAQSVKGQQFQEMQGEAKAPSQPPPQKKREYIDPEDFTAWRASQRR